MAEITSVIWNSYSHDNISAIPADVLMLLGEDELLDRLDAAAELDDKAAGAPSSDLAVGYNDRRRQLLEARPRTEIEDRVEDLAEKADMMTDPTHRAALRQRIHDLKRQNPAAPVRPRAAKLSPAAVARRAEYEAMIREMIKAEIARQTDPSLQTKADSGLRTQSDQLTALQARTDQLAAHIAERGAQIQDVLLKQQAAHGRIQTPDMVKAAPRTQGPNMVKFDKTRGFDGR